MSVLKEHQVDLRTEYDVVVARQAVRQWTEQAKFSLVYPDLARGLIQSLVEQAHAMIGIQRRPDPRQLQPEFDQGDGHGRLHPHHHRLGIEHA